MVRKTPHLRNLFGNIDLGRFCSAALQGGILEASTCPPRRALQLETLWRQKSKSKNLINPGFVSGSVNPQGKRRMRSQSAPAITQDLPAARSSRKNSCAGRLNFCWNESTKYPFSPGSIYP